MPMRLLTTFGIFGVLFEGFLLFLLGKQIRVLITVLDNLNVQSFYVSIECE